MLNNFPAVLKVAKEPGVITQSLFDAWNFLHSSPSFDVAKAPIASIDTIYFGEYWQPYCDLLPVGVDLVFFDFSIVEGVSEAVAALQHALSIGVDRHFGMVTMQAVRRIGQDAESLTVGDVILYMTERRRYRDFGRATMIKDRALEMAKNGIHSTSNVVA